ncbi:MAG: HGGxSTG domain-containing protein [Pseudorhodobacter sp.]
MDPREDGGRYCRRFAADQARKAEAKARRTTTRCVVYEAKIRKGAPCWMKSEPGRRRCKFHGGRSTGARTPEDIERIREAQRHRWAKVRGQSSME